MVNFIHLFEPHFATRMIRDVAAAPSQDEADELLREVALAARGEEDSESRWRERRDEGMPFSCDRRSSTGRCLRSAITPGSHLSDAFRTNYAHCKKADTPRSQRESSANPSHSNLFEPLAICRCRLPAALCDELLPTLGDALVRSRTMNARASNTTTTTTTVRGWTV
jgi:hypothetical protein